MVGGETTTFAGIWEGCRECIRVAIGARDERKDINHIIAPVGSSAQCYCSVLSITAVSKFMKDQQEASGNRKSHKELLSLRIFLMILDNCKLNVDQQMP